MNTSKMNYIAQLNKFETLCDKLPPKAQFLYYKLFKWSNRHGLGEPFQLANSVLMEDAGITNAHTLVTCRNILKDAGFIEFSSGKKGNPTTYRLVDLTGKKGDDLSPKPELFSDDLSLNNNKKGDDLSLNNEKYSDKKGDKKGDDLSPNNASLPYSININYKNKKENYLKEKPETESQKDETGISEDGWEVARYYEQRFGLISSTKVSQLNDLVEDYGKEIVMFAIRQGNTGNASNIQYIRTVAMNEARKREQIGLNRISNGTGDQDISDPFLQQLHEQAKRNGNVV